MCISAKNKKPCLKVQADVQVFFGNLMTNERRLEHWLIWMLSEHLDGPFEFGNEIINFFLCVVKCK